MKCPVCEGEGRAQVCAGKVGEYYYQDCNHCRGTGEIQEGDWWMCVCGHIKTILYFQDEGFLPHKDANCAYWCNFEPLYRME